MRKRDNFFSFFLIFLFLSLIFWGLSSLGILNGVRYVLEKITSPFEGAKYSFLQKLPSFFEDPTLKKLISENMALRAQISSQKRLEEENAALLDQFKTTTPRSLSLLPSQIIGTPGFVPGVFAPTTFLINKGTKDGINEGFAVVYKDNVVGKITKPSFLVAEVALVNNPNFSFVAKTQNGVLGVLKGNSEGMILDNVVLSQTLNNSDTVLTYGDINIEGVGYPANLIVGKIISVDKNPSALFQKAEIESLLDFSKLTTVFVVLKP